MTIEIAEDWFDNNISGQEGFTLDSENEVYRKTISEADLTFEFSGGGETVETFFSLWMWHQAGHPTTGHCTETMGIKSYSKVKSASEIVFL